MMKACIERSRNDEFAAYHETPSVTLERLARLEGMMLEEIRELQRNVPKVGPAEP